jgi:hypothetical protein
MEESAGHRVDEAATVIGGTSPHGTDWVPEMLEWGGRRGKRQ